VLISGVEMELFVPHASREQQSNQASSQNGKARSAALGKAHRESDRVCRRCHASDKYGFATTEGEIKGVRTFGQMVKHLSATNYIPAAAALREELPADAGDA